MLTVFFAPHPRRYEDLSSVDTHRLACFFHAPLDPGVLLAPSQLETFFVNAAHGPEDVEHTVAAAAEAFARAR